MGKLHSPIIINVGPKIEHDHPKLAMEEKSKFILHDAPGSTFLKENLQTFY